MSPARIEAHQENPTIGKSYPLCLIFTYRAYARGLLVQSGFGETIETGSTILKLRIAQEIPASATEFELAIAWPVALNSVTPLQWAVEAKRVCASGDGLLVRIVRHEFRTVGARRREMLAACG